MDDRIEQRLSIEGWRRENYVRLGFKLSDAAELAVNDEISWHDIENFLQEHPTCKPEIALHIVR